MRLLYITAGYPFGGTAESFLEPELAALAALGVQIDVLPVRRNGAARPMPAGVRLRPETLRGSWRGVAPPRGARGLASASFRCSQVSARAAAQRRRPAAGGSGCSCRV